jgi:hypothetical protein
MFFNAPTDATKVKHVVYLAAATVLGLLLSFLAHALIEMQYLAWAESTGRVVTFNSSCALHPALQAALWLGGAIGGFFVGRLWWRMVYIDRVWAKGRELKTANKALLRQPSAWLPLAMSAAALVVLLGHAALFGFSRQADEGTTANLFQLLIALQLPIVAVFAARSLPRAPKPALGVLALQFTAICLNFAVLFYFEHI